MRLESISQKADISPQDIENFVFLEDKMNCGDLADDWLRSFHLSNDDYMRLLQKVLKAAVKVGEPYAREKLQEFIEEKGSQGPAVFLTPWDMTLAYLDENVGDIIVING